MHQDAIIRRGPSFEQWAIPLAAVALAVAIGIMVATGGWIYLPGFALIPLLWYWPVEIGVGAAVVMLPFEYVSMLNTGSADGNDRSLMSVAIVLAFVVLCAVGVAGRRLQWPSATVFWWGLFASWAAASILWAVDPSKCLE